MGRKRTRTTEKNSANSDQNQSSISCPDPESITAQRVTNTDSEEKGLWPQFKVHIFWDDHKILRNLQQLFDWQYTGQIIGRDFAKFCGLLRIYELYCPFFDQAPCFQSEKGNQSTWRKTFAFFLSVDGKMKKKKSFANQFSVFAILIKQERISNWDPHEVNNVNITKNVFEWKCMWKCFLFQTKRWT